METKLWVIADAELSEGTEAEIVEGDSKDPEGRRSGADTGGGFGSNPVVEVLKGVSRRRRVPLDAKAIKSQMKGLLTIVDDLFEQATTETSLELSEVEITVEINAEGQVSLVGNGGKLSNTGGITLKFVRSSQPVG